MVIKLVAFICLFYFTASMNILLASEVSSIADLQKKIEGLEKEVLNLKMKNIVQNKFEWQILKLSEIENDIKRLHNSFEILENNYYKDLKSIRGLTNDIKNRVQSLEGDDSADAQIINQNKIDDQSLESNEQSFKLSEHSEILSDALNLFKNDSLPESEARFTSFIEKYPQSRELSNAFFWRAEVKARRENWIGAANDYLESFSLDPSGKNAPKTLFGLGVSLGAIGEKEQACLTLEEVEMRFPEIEGSLSEEIEKAKKLLDCG